MSKYGRYLIPTVFMIVVVIFAIKASSTGVQGTKHQLSNKIEISTFQIQKAVNKSLPISLKEGKFAFAIEKANVNLNSDWEFISLTMDVKLTKKIRRGKMQRYKTIYRGKVLFSGELNYKNRLGKFYLSNIVLRKSGKEQLTVKQVRKIKNILIPQLQKRLNRNSIVSLKTKNLKDPFNKLSVKNIGISKNKINLDMSI